VSFSDLSGSSRPAHVVNELAAAAAVFIPPTQHQSAMNTPPAAVTSTDSDAGTTPTLLAAPLAAVIASGALLLPTLMSASSSPSPNHPRIMLWYQTLRQPWFKPPDIAIPIAWTGIEAALAFSTFRLLRAPASAAKNKALGLMALNVAMIGGWSRFFFKQRNLPVSTAAAAAMIVSGAALAVQAKKVDKSAAAATLPFVAWVAFATVLTASIWHLNSKR
jgi:translocator protein